MTARSVAAVVTVIVACVFGGVGRASPASHTVASFFTPEKAAYCKFHIPLGFNLNVPPPLECWTPNDGFTVWMRPKSAVKKAYIGDHKWHYARSVRRLTFVQNWWGSNMGLTADADGVHPIYEEGTGSPRGTVQYRCQSRSTGLTCTNRAGHGWWLGRFKGYRIF